MNFYTSDLHLFHDSILKYCDRPFDNTRKMWGTIKRNWNNVITAQDDVWVVGDLTLKRSDYVPALETMIKSLNGTKHMIVAPTHDLLLPRQYEEIGFATTHYPMIKSNGGWFVAHDPALATVCPKGSVLLCGHVHNLWKEMTTDTGVTLINVGVDVRDFTPISEIQLLECIRRCQTQRQSKKS